MMDIVKIGKSKFFSIIPAFTCMLRCKMCYHWKREPNLSEAVTIDRWKEFLTEVKPFVEKGCQINFAGGETFSREGIFELIKFSNENGYASAAVTNAFLIDSEMAKRVTDTGLQRIGISLDSLDEETHDYLRGIQGSYKRAIQAIRYLKAFNPEIHIDIQTVILGMNISGLSELVEWAQRNNDLHLINLQAVSQPFDISPDNSWYKKDSGALWPKDIGIVREVLDHLIELKEKGYKIGNSARQLNAFKAYFENPDIMVKKCNIFGNSFEVDYYGNVKFCPMEEIGNIRKQNISDIFRSDAIGSVSRKIANCRRICHFGINCFFETADIESFNKVCSK